MFNLVKRGSGRLGVALVVAMLAASGFAQESTPPVDPTAIVSAVEAQMTAIITAGVGLLIFGIVAGVGWRFAKRFLRG